MNLFKRTGILAFIITALFLNTGFTTVRAETATESKRSVISIDAGRKYFSEDQVI